MTNPTPSDPGGASAMDEESTLVDGARSMVDGGSSGTDEGPAGIPAALTGVDRDGDPVAPPPAALPDSDGPGSAGPTRGPASEQDALSPTDASPPQTVSEGRS